MEFRVVTTEVPSANQEFYGQRDARRVFTSEDGQFTILLMSYG